MPYVSAARLRKALENLSSHHPFFGVTFLCMKQCELPIGTPVLWSSKQETAFLDKYYRPPGAPPKKPYFSPFGRDEGSNWRAERFSSTSLQSARTREAFSRAFVHPRDTSKWAFVPGYLNVLAKQLPDAGRGRTKKLPTYDLIAWLFRDREFPNSFGELLKLFREEFKLSDAIEFAELFDTDSTNETDFFADTQIDVDELIEIVGGTPIGAQLAGRTEDEILKSIENHVANVARLSLPSGFVANFYNSLKAQRFIILAGRPGTGKTAFARAYTNALNCVFPDKVRELIVSIGHDFSEADAIGYEKIAGGLAASKLTSTLFLSKRPHDIYVVVLEEMNLAEADYYLARILPGIESNVPVELPGASEEVLLPPDAYFIGTINSYLEESTRLPLSGPVKRRANVIEMPNRLDQVVLSDEKEVFGAISRSLLEQTSLALKRRQEEGTASVFDRFKVDAIACALKTSTGALSADTLDPLWEIAKACAGDRRTSLTLGIVQDVLDYMAFNTSLSVADALDRQVNQKILPQLAGPKQVAEGLLLVLENTGDRFPISAATLRDLISAADMASGLIFPKY